MKSQRITIQVAQNVWTKCHSDPSSDCWDVSLRASYMNLMMALEEKSGSPKSLWLILWGPWISPQNPIFEIFKWWTNRPTLLSAKDFESLQIKSGLHHSSDRDDHKTEYLTFVLSHANDFTGCNVSLLSLSTSLVRTEISQQLLEGSPWNFAQTFMISRRWILLTFPLEPPWGSHFLFRIKYHDNYWMERHEILSTHLCPPQDES